MIKSTIKNAMFKWFPRTATRIFAARARAYSQALVESWGCTRLSSKLIERFGNKVLHGPFTGIAISPEARREHVSPYLLGVYESELNEAWASIFQMKFSQMLDVGAKFGFYAVGLAQRFPGVPVLAFDPDPWARRATQEMSAANAAPVQVLGYCSPEWMRENLQKNSFILSDCEGYEATLFGTGDIPNLASATMLIEIHEQCSPGVARLIEEAYSKTHTVVTIASRTEGSECPPELAFLSEDERYMATNEYRAAEQAWMFLTPKGM
jgi:hypothetical protein